MNIKIIYNCFDLNEESEGYFKDTDKAICGQFYSFSMTHFGAVECGSGDFFTRFDIDQLLNCEEIKKIDIDVIRNELQDIISESMVENCNNISNDMICDYIIENDFYLDDKDRNNIIYNILDNKWSVCDGDMYLLILELARRLGFKGIADYGNDFCPYKIFTEYLPDKLEPIPDTTEEWVRQGHTY